MDNKISSVGKVQTQSFESKETLILESGDQLESLEMIFETYGNLNPERTNAILVCHALSGNHHSALYYEDPDERKGWWDSLIGPGKAIDTDKYFVVSPNNLGGCHGTTGPTSIDPKTQEIYGPDFPMVTVSDWVNCQALLADHLGIKVWHAVIGGSLGGMQALNWSITYPDRIRKAIVIAAAPKLSAQNIAFNEVARQAIITDSDYQDGYYLKAGKSPKRGLRLARMVGHITYLSDEAMRDKFGRELKEDKLNFGYGAEFEVESYLRYQGDVFSESFDANTYLLMTKLLDYFDPADKCDGSLVKAFEPIKAQVMVVSFTSDWRFSPERSKEISDALLEANKNVSYLEIESTHGHDSFLFSEDRYVRAIKAFLGSGQ